MFPNVSIGHGGEYAFNSVSFLFFTLLLPSQKESGNRTHTNNKCMIFSLALIGLSLPLPVPFVRC